MTQETFAEAITLDEKIQEYEQQVRDIETIIMHVKERGRTNIWVEYQLPKGKEDTFVVEYEEKRFSLSLEQMQTILNTKKKQLEIVTEKFARL